MRIARKLTLLAMLAIAAAAFAAPSAFAQSSTEPEAHNQTPRLIVQQELHAGVADTNCPLVTPSPPVAPPALPPTTAGGGCRGHASGPNIVLSRHDAAGAEAVSSVCNVEMDIRVDVAGEGYLTHQELTGDPATCVVRPCGGATPPGTSEGRIWSFFMFESEVAGSTARERLTALFCVEPIPPLVGPASHCEVTLPFTQPTTHRYQFVATDVNGHAPAGTTRCELDGTFNIEATPGTSTENLAEQNIEIRHN